MKSQLSLLAAKTIKTTLHLKSISWIWSITSERNKSLKIKNLVEENNFHQSSVQLPLSYKSIKVNPFQFEADGSEVNNSDNFRASKYIDENNKFLICNTDFIKRRKRFDIFSRPQYFKLQGSSILNKNIELIN